MKKFIAGNDKHLNKEALAIISRIEDCAYEIYKEYPDYSIMEINCLAHGAVESAYLRARIGSRMKSKREEKNS